tara:strand:- start:495 stop:989 length:495 start_codon:yes stop_codon:yes gene_type:complete
MLKGNQVKLDKNKDGKISGKDFKMMKSKKGSMAQKKPGGAILGTLALGMLGQKFLKSKNSKSTSIPATGLLTKMLKDKKDKNNKETEQKTARHGGYMTKANKGMMMNKPSTRGFGAARTSGMGLENEALQPGKIYDKVKAKKGKMAKASMGEFITVSEYSEDLI